MTKPMLAVVSLALFSALLPGTAHAVHGEVAGGGTATAVGHLITGNLTISVGAATDRSVAPVPFQARPAHGYITVASNDFRVKSRVECVQVFSNPFVEDLDNGVVYSTITDISGDFPLTDEVGGALTLGVLDNGNPSQGTGEDIGSVEAGRRSPSGPFGCPAVNSGPNTGFVLDDGNIAVNPGENDH